jgi:hypothetical protein
MSDLNLTAIGYLLNNQRKIKNTARLDVPELSTTLDQLIAALDAARGCDE